LTTYEQIVELEKKRQNLLKQNAAWIAKYDKSADGSQQKRDALAGSLSNSKEIALVEAEINRLCDELDAT
jgi:uncharacterized protein YecT (DUF1311 family)